MYVLKKNVEEMDFQFEELEMKASLAICNLNKTFSDGSTSSFSIRSSIYQS